MPVPGPVRPREIEMFTRESPVNLPALPGREDATEGIALAKALSTLSRIEKGGPDFRPFPLQYVVPFRDRRRWGVEQPPGARPPRSGKARQRRIPVDGLGDNLRQGEAPAVDFFVRLHGANVAPFSYEAAGRSLESAESHCINVEAARKDSRSP